MRKAKDGEFRSKVDRLELYLALFGYDGWNYDLTFDDEHLPATFRDVRNLWGRMLYRMRKRHPDPIDYVCRIEGLHGDHRYHIHLTVRYSDFPPVVMKDLWPYGYVSGAPLLCVGRDPYDTYRRTAKYYCKERTDGIKIPVGVQPWAVSRSLRAQEQIEPCILAGCPEGGVVLDPFAGSGCAAPGAGRRSP